MRYGYPFDAVEVEFDESTGNFDIKAGVPLPVFPIEGMTTRQAGVEPAHARLSADFPRDVVARTEGSVRRTDRRS